MRWLVGAVALAACLAPRAPAPPVTSADREAIDSGPTLVVFSPDRGTFVEGTSVVVNGRVHGGGRAAGGRGPSVTVDGKPVAVAPDGTFTTTLAVEPGLAILEIHAIDASGHDVRDVRSVLAGAFAPSDGSVRAGIAARIGRRAMAALGSALATSIASGAGNGRTIDFTATARALNPVYDDDGCIGARVDIDSLAAGKIDVALVPKPGAIETSVAVDDVVVHANVRYRLACVAGTTTMTIHTNARVRGDLRPALADRRIHTTLPKPSVVLDEFRVDIAGVPGPIDRLVRGRIRGGVEAALVEAIGTKLPALADAKLAEVLAQPAPAALFGSALAIDIAPSKLALAPDGLIVAADATLVVEGGERGRYVATRASVDDVAADRADAGVWISTDALHQLLSGLWAARAFERSIPRDALGPLAMLLDGEVHAIEVGLSLPPTLRAGESVELAIGDLLVTLRDAGGGELQRFAISLRSTLALEPGRLALATTEPTIYVQLLEQRTTLERPLDAAAVEGIVKLAWSSIAARLDEALARVPMPALGGVGLALAPARPGLIVFAVTVAPR